MDKQRSTDIDLLLSGLGRRDGVVPAVAENGVSDHLDADTISAFSENALPAKARLHAISHLADCPECRRRLRDQGPLPLPATEQANKATEPNAKIGLIAWLRGAFRNPTVLYGLPAALSIVIIGGIYLQVERLRRHESIGQTNSTSVKPKSDSDSVQSNNLSIQTETSQSKTFTTTNSNSAATAGQFATPTQPLAQVANPEQRESVKVQNGAANDQPTPATKKELDDAEEKTSKSAVKPIAGNDKIAEADELRQVPSLSNTVKNSPPAAPEQKQAASEPSGMASGTQAQNRGTPKDKADAPVTSNGTSMAPANEASARSERRKTATDGTRDDDSRIVGGTFGARRTSRTVGGRSFTFADGTWTDSAYDSSKSTIGVKRGSDHYRELLSDEPGLRVYPETLSGTVIVAWKGKFYRFH